MITDREAYRIAALWQSPGRIGRHLAAIASGAWTADDLDKVEHEDEEVIKTRRDYVINDIENTLGAVVNNEDRAELYALMEWAQTRGVENMIN
jgi:hypothetical protein